MILTPLNRTISEWTGRKVWIIGGSSGIGRTTAHELHARGARLVVSARDRVSLQAFCEGHPGSESVGLDVTDLSQMRSATARVIELLGGSPDLVMYCAGHYRAMAATQFDLGEALRHDDVNYRGALYLLDSVLSVMISAGRGHISLVGSVAGYRGLPLALAYGPSKAALNYLAQNLYMDLRPRGVSVSLICPGFVETPLTAANEFRMPALISPETAAAEILRGWAQGRFEIHFPLRFTAWLKLLELLPARWHFALMRQLVGRESRPDALRPG